MATTVTLTAATRQDTGKGAARTLRRAGQIPAVIYGRGREPESLMLESVTLHKAMTTIHGSTIIDVQVDGREPVKALVREVQRHPIRPESILHVDLYEVHAGEQIEVDVAIQFEGIPDGVRNFGGVLDHATRTLEIRVLPSDIPERVAVDVTNLGIGQSIFVRDIQIPNAEILTDPDVPVCSVVAPRTAEVTPEEEVAEEEVTEPELIRKVKAEDETEETTS